MPGEFTREVTFDSWRPLRALRTEDTGQAGACPDQVPAIPYGAGDAGQERGGVADGGEPEQLLEVPLAEAIQPAEDVADDTDRRLSERIPQVAHQGRHRRIIRRQPRPSRRSCARIPGGGGGSRNWRR